MGGCLVLKSLHELHEKDVKLTTSPPHLPASPPGDSGVFGVANERTAETGAPSATLFQPLPGLRVGDPVVWDLDWATGRLQGPQRSQRRTAERDVLKKERSKSKINGANCKESSFGFFAVASWLYPCSSCEVQPAEEKRRSLLTNPSPADPK